MQDEKSSCLDAIVVSGQRLPTDVHKLVAVDEMHVVVELREADTAACVPFETMSVSELDKRQLSY